MKKYYYDTLTKEEKRKINDEYKKEYGNSDINQRLNRLIIYSVISVAFGLFLIIYSLITKRELVSNLAIGIPLFILAFIFIIGRYNVKKKIINKIALKNKK